MRLRMVFGAVANVGVLCLALAAHAAPDVVSQAREQFRAAELKEAQGDYAGALALFQQVAAVRLTAAVHFHIALCEEKLGRQATAYERYSLAKRAAEETKQAETATASQAAMARLLPTLPRLRVRCSPTPECGAVRIDGVLATPDHEGVYRVDSGVRKVEARVADHSVQQDVSAVANKVIDVELRGDRDPKPTPNPPSTTTATPTSTTTPATAGQAPAGTSSNAGGVGAARGGREAQQPQDVTTEASGSKLPALAFAGGALAVAGFGVVSFLVAGEAQDEGREACRTLLACDGQRERVRLWDGLALGSFITAGALAITSAVFWFTSSSTRGNAQRAARFEVGAGALPSGAAVRVGGAF
jgi:hypothetical protein